jgi:hypothetical protein
MLYTRVAKGLFGAAAVAAASLGPSMLSAVHPAAASPLPVVTCPTQIPPPGQPATDSIKLGNVSGISFGSGGLDQNNQPNCAGAVQWTIPPNTVLPIITGTMYMQNVVGKTARVHVDYYDIHGNSIVEQSSPDKLAQKKSETLDVNIGTKNDPRMYRVDVSTQVLVNSGGTSSWVTQAIASAYIGSGTLPNQACQIDANKIEFSFAGKPVNGHPVDTATCGLIPGGAYVDGDLWFEDGQGKNVRVALSTYDVHGTPLPESYGPEVSPKDNGIQGPYYTYVSYNNDLIYSAKLTLELEKGTNNWVQYGPAVTWTI